VDQPRITAGSNRQARPGFALLVTARQLEIDADVAFQVRLRPIKVEIADGDAGVVAAHAGVDGLADNPVHTGKRADVDHPVQTLAGKIDGLPDVHDHLARSARRRKIRLGVVEQFLNVLGLFIAVKLLAKQRQQVALILFLNVRANA
jgi:hypothetical protein